MSNWAAQAIRYAVRTGMCAMWLLAEISIGELAMQLSGGRIVSARSFFNCREVTKPHRFAVNRNSGAPPIRVFTPLHALVSADAVAMSLHVVTVFTRSGRPKIISRVVQAVAIFVVNFDALPNAKNYAMHLDGTRLAIRQAYGARSVKWRRWSGLTRRPLPL